MLTTIKTLVKQVLENYTDFEKSKELIDQIYEQLRTLTKMKNYENELQYMAAVPTAAGKALSLKHAAECLLDYKRTAKFLKGMVSLIEEKQQQHPGEQIHVFYAGCGPYAPFVTLIAPLFTPEEIRFSILEINEPSLFMAKHLIVDLGLSDYIKECYKEDAITFKVPEAEKYHILFSETLDSLLYREAYVPILWNLLPQFSKECTLIPENVVITTSFTLPQSEEEEFAKEVFFGTVFDTRKAVNVNDGTQTLPEKFLAKKLVADEINEEYQNMVLDTEVHIYKDIRLTRMESSLTIPLQMLIPRPLTFNDMEFFYQLKPSVELKCNYN